ncbi:MAG: hypothetical protein JSW41_05545 [Candidatus Aenigmatarchaeota archaeon]|nr:MAG: hypothetical protein JSW41_05545 [Candidatus Aenigmarchaeota archaeon]
MMKDGKLDMLNTDEHTVALVVACPECDNNHIVKICVMGIETKSLEE